MSHRLSGQPLHTDRHELHGITVVLEARGDATYIGRFDSQDEHGVHLLDVGVFDPASGTREAFLRRSVQFGIRVDRPKLTVATAEVTQLTPLGQLEL